MNLAKFPHPNQSNTVPVLVDPITRDAMSSSYRHAFLNVAPASPQVK